MQNDIAKFKNGWVTLIFFLVLAASFFIWYSDKSNSSVDIKIGDAVIHAEIAETPEKRARGLSGRSGIGENEGMFFIFEQPGYYGIWMKEMKFPIDIIWFGEDKRIVDVAGDVAPNTYPQVFKPWAPAKYVLEVHVGWASIHNLEVGDLAEF